MTIRLQQQNTRKSGFGWVLSLAKALMESIE